MYLLVSGKEESTQKYAKNIAFHQTWGDVEQQWFSLIKLVLVSAGNMQFAVLTLTHAQMPLVPALKMAGLTQGVMGSRY